MIGNSPLVRSNQDDVHPNLVTILERRKASSYQAPIKRHTVKTFDAAFPLLTGGKPLIFDSGCGNGYSSCRIAEIFPEYLVVGIDRSEARLKKSTDTKYLPDNLLLLRAELGDFWRLCQQNGITLSRHYLLYPNPYPKKAQIRRRWYAHPAFPAFLALGGELVLRSNWKIYCHEFQLALEQFSGIKSSVKELSAISTPSALSAFELKYINSGHRIFELSATLR